jgi:hypothetical protein
MKLLHIAYLLLLLPIAVFNMWVWKQSRFWVPRYIHWLAVIAFMLGCLTAYLLFTLGKSWVSLLWVPFMFSGIVYSMFVVHSASVILDTGPKKHDAVGE